MSKNVNTTPKDDRLTITHLDHNRLTQLIQNLRGNKSIDPQYLNYLGMELLKANKIDSKRIMPDFVTMNSVVNICFIESGNTMEVRLVYPQSAYFAKGLISVLSPLGCALLGYKAGDVVTFSAPKGEQKVKINNVVYQPEANGEDLS